MPIILRVKLFTFLEFVLEGSECVDVTESCLLNVGIDLLDSFLGVVDLSSSLLSPDISLCLEV